jgi:hypothetical protein
MGGLWRLKLADQEGLAESAGDYLRGFSWNKVKHRSDKSIAQLLESLHKVCDTAVPGRGCGEVQSREC